MSMIAMDTLPIASFHIAKISFSALFGLLLKKYQRSFIWFTKVVWTVDL